MTDPLRKCKEADCQKKKNCSVSQNFLNTLHSSLLPPLWTIALELGRCLACSLQCAVEHF